MEYNRQASYGVPQSKQPFRFSKAAAGLLAATLALGVLLTFSTIQNINRAQLLMENFLHEKGETILRSIEAGGRASMIMMHHMSGVDPLHTLLIENSKEENILFIAVLNPDGSILDQAGYPEPSVFSEHDIQAMTESGQTLTRLNRTSGVFTYSKMFTVGDHRRRMHLPAEDRQKWLLQLADSQKIISIGLDAKEFESARKQDVRHALFMAAILFLVGFAGLYVLFLYHKVRQTGATLADMKLYTDSVIDSIPVSLVTLDAREHIVSCNRNAEDLFGYSLAELHGKNIQEALPNISNTFVESCGTSIEKSVDSPGRDGKTIPLIISCSPLLNHEDVNIGKVLIMQDVSSIKNLEIQLERSRRMAALGQMAAGIAHEIRNPLGTLRGFAQFFGNQEVAGKDSKQYSELMISEIDRLNQTISGLLQFSRPREPQLQRINLDDLLKNVTILIDGDLKNHAVHFHCQTDTGIEMDADPDLLLQILMNLLKNSINATREGDEISVRCSEDEQLVRISVEDTGCGMSSKVRERMFDPFFTTTKTGTGLGLAVSHQILEQHHGEFEVVTEAGRGTAVTVKLPKHC